MNQKSINLIDSFGSVDNVALRKLQDYLAAESVDKLKRPLEGEWKQKNCKDQPKQQNKFDCGVFVCMYAEYIARKKELDFHQRDMPYFRMKMVKEISGGVLLN